VTAPQNNFIYRVPRNEDGNINLKHGTIKYNNPTETKVKYSKETRLGLGVALVMLPQLGLNEGTRFANCATGNQLGLMPLDAHFNQDLHSQTDYHVLLLNSLPDDDKRIFLNEPQRNARKLTNASGIHLLDLMLVLQLQKGSRRILTELLMEPI